MRELRLILILLLPLLFLTTCKKYPEDPFISLRTVKMRLEGEWQLERIEINGENVGYLYNDSLAPFTFKDFKFWFVFDFAIETPVGTKKETKDVLVINTSSRKKSDATNNVDISGTPFYFFPEKEKTFINVGTAGYLISTKEYKISTILFNLLTTYSWRWQIKTLYNKVFVIEKNKDNLNYRISFKKIRNH